MTAKRKDGNTSYLKISLHFGKGGDINKEGGNIKG